MDLSTIIYTTTTSFFFDCLNTIFVNSALQSHLFFFLLSRGCSACANLIVHFQVVNKYHCFHQLPFPALNVRTRFPSKVWNIKNKCPLHVKRLILCRFAPSCLQTIFTSTLLVLLSEECLLEIKEASLEESWQQK